MDNKNFMAAMQTEADKAQNYSETENGAVGYKSTGSELLNINFAASSFRSMPESGIAANFEKAYDEGNELAMKWAFYLRDVRGGMGERRSFRAIIKWLADNHLDDLKKVISMIPEYGRWDDLFVLFGTKGESAMAEVVKAEWAAETKDAAANTQRIYGLAKWAPSENASSEETKMLSSKVRGILGVTPRDYRKALSKMRAISGVVETKMSANDWKDIDFSKVPSKASANYAKAFDRHDQSRYEKYLEDVKAGVAKINAGAILPPDIYHKVSTMIDLTYGKANYDFYNCSGFRKIDGYTVSAQDKAAVDALNLQWNSLPAPAKDLPTTLVITDGSGSMTAFATKGSEVMNIDIGRALGIYFAEHCKGEFHNKMITFSEHPEFIDLDKAPTQDLAGKIACVSQYDEVANTDIKKVFDLILKTAKNGNMAQSDLPGTVLIISDMEFDQGATGLDAAYDPSVKDPTLFGEIGAEFEAAGYKLPRLVYWNLGSRSGTIPMTQNDKGVCLVSGYSQNAVKMFMDGDTDPYKALVKVLMSDRYAAVTLK